MALEIFSEHHNVDQLAWAMQSVKDAMKWDEDVFGLEYDLDVYNIVAVGDFNMGAMENKGLNVFNTACVLAKSDTATDGDFERVQGVIAHERTAWVSTIDQEHRTAVAQAQGDAPASGKEPSDRSLEGSGRGVRVRVHPEPE